MGSPSITLTRKSGKTQTFIPEVPVRQYYRIRQDDEIDPGLYGRGGTNRPMVFRLQVHRSIPFNQKMQEYCFGLNRSEDEARDRRLFADCYDTWSTNDGKIRDSRNYITNEGVGKPDPKWANLVMGRNVICGDEVVSDGSYGIRAGTKCLRVETLDPDNLPVGYTYKTHPHLIHHCTIINSAAYEGKNKVLPFPQMGGKTIPPKLPVFYPLMSRVPVYIEMWMLIKLVPGSEIPNPYHPAWDWGK